MIYSRHSTSYLGELVEIQEGKCGIKGRLNKAIDRLYDPFLCSIRTRTGSERWCQVSTGVKQGSVLSPLLFIAYMDAVISDFRENRGDDSQNRIMAYADDIAEWSTDKKEIEKDLLRWNECFSMRCMRMNVEKKHQF